MPNENDNRTKKGACNDAFNALATFLFEQYRKDEREQQIKEAIEYSLTEKTKDLTCHKGNQNE